MAFEQGQWIDALDGIGRVEFSQDHYVEEFHFEWEGHKQELPTDRVKKLGDHLQTVVVYKLLCKFDGKLRKRGLLTSCNARYCNELEKKSKAVLEKIKTGQPDAYQRFLDYREKKPFGAVIGLEIVVTTESAPLIEGKLRAITENLACPYTFDEFNELAKREDLDLLGDIGSRTSDDLVIGIHMFNEMFKVRDKRALFTETDIRPPRHVI